MSIENKFSNFSTNTETPPETPEKESIFNDIYKTCQEISELKEELDSEDGEIAITNNRDVARKILAKTSFVLLFLFPGCQFTGLALKHNKEILLDLEEKIQKYLHI